MPEFKDIEQVFLGILQDEIDRDGIIKKTKYFKDYNWQCLGEFAIKHDLFPPFYHRLLGLNLDNIPPPLLSRFKNLYLTNLKRNMVLEGELFKIISHLRENNIPVIPLKGPVLAGVLYSNLALRQTSFDLDILIKSEDIEEAQERLRELNYFILYDQDQINVMHKFSFEINLYKQERSQRSIMLDLHWGLCDRTINAHHLEEFWQNAQYINLDGQKILIPSHKDLLLYLALISAYNNFPINNLFDIHQLITKYGKDLDWQGLLNESKQNNLDKILYFTLKLCKDLFDSKVPKEFLDTLRPIFIKEGLFKYWINKNIFKRSIDYSYTRDFFIIPYLYAKNIFDYIRVIYKKIFEPMAKVMVGYNQPKSSVSYYLYIKRLLKPFTQFYVKRISKF